MKGTKSMRIAGWILSFLIATFLIVASAMGKFTDWPGKEEMFAKMGWTTEVMFNIGIVEVVIAILFLIPRVAFIGAILLTAYLGGAVATHVRVAEPFWFPIVLAVLMWVALGLRQPQIFAIAFGIDVGAPRETESAKIV